MRLLRRRKSLRLKTMLMGLCAGTLLGSSGPTVFPIFARGAGLRPSGTSVMVAPPFLLGSTLSDIFREIEDELRRENLQRLWSRFGKYIIGLVVLAVVATAAFMGWRDYQQRQRQAQGVHYVAALALAREGKDAEAGAAF